MVLEPRSPRRRRFTDWVYEALSHRSCGLPPCSLRDRRNKSCLFCLFVCCLFLVREPVPVYEGSCRGESQVLFGVRTQELKEFCHEIKEGGDGFNYLPWRLRDRITKETH